MKFPIRILAVLALVGAFITACDDDTTSIGSGMMPVQDSLSTFYETFPIMTRSQMTGAVVANTSNCFIGSYVDPETDVQTTCGFLAQFHLQEDYALPEASRMIKDAAGNIVADSCVIRIFHDKYYGDSLTTMKLRATDLRLDNVMEEGRTYYTDIDPKEYVNPAPKVTAISTYTVIDQNLSTLETSLSSGNYRTIPVNIGKDYGTYILQSYYAHPEYFKNSYTFSHNVCPGFYIEHAGGVGTMINADVSALDVYFRYQENDTTVSSAWMRLGATQEVIQSNRVKHGNLDKLFDADGYAYDEKGAPFTYIKSPAAVHTEIKLPVSQIATGEHYNDTLNSARFTLRRYVVKDQTANTLTPPQYLLLIRKGHEAEFFAENRLPDSETTFLCQYSSSNGAYTFNNIAPLITYLRKERDAAAGVTLADDEKARKAKWEALAARDEYWREGGDWETLELIPVSAEYTTVQSLYSSSKKVLVAVRNDHTMHSVKLEGSKNGEVKLNVIYSRFVK